MKKKQSRRMDRRSFLSGTFSSIAAAAVPLYLPGSILGKDGAVSPSNQINLAGIGINHRGSYVLGYFLEQADVRFRAICDVRRDRREAVKQRADELYGTTETAMYRDFRELLERTDIDAVLIATGDHWHATASIYASNAGKDVYSEKPCALTIDQCRILAETMNRNKTVFQGGTQRRNVENCRLACELARSGKLGKIHTVHASIYYLYYRTDWYEAEPVPDREEIDWDLWLGPSPWRPYNKRYVMGDWRGHYDFDSGARHLDWGAHTVDLCQFALGKDGTTPVQFWSEGNRMYATYADGVQLVMRPDGWLGLGTCPVRFEGEDGWVEVGDSGRMVVSPDALRPAMTKILRKDAGNNLSFGECPRGHVRNFLDCIKTRQLPACNQNVIRSSHIACHASALSWILQRPLTFDPAREEFVGDDQANRMRARAMRAPWHI
ncbi:MAG: Gfo/Idh/MocA family oxidoreductase [Planctomycetia bacterium]|nr:Gfo/Idh/MocA family oxidoreductase [Planctomycetia bacterium]